MIDSIACNIISNICALSLSLSHSRKICDHLMCSAVWYGSSTLYFTSIFNLVIPKWEIKFYTSYCKNDRILLVFCCWFFFFSIIRHKNSINHLAKVVVFLATSYLDTKQTQNLMNSMIFQNKKKTQKISNRNVFRF